jgi:hypothetical protein
MSSIRPTVDWVFHGLGSNITGDTMTYRYYCLIVLLLLSSSLYSISAPTTLPEFQQLYQSSSAKLDAEHQSSIDSIHHQYEMALEGRMLAAKKGADFAGYKELMAEKARFSSEKTLPEGAFLSHVRAAEAAKAKKLSILSSQYIGALKKLQASMMMKNLMVAAEMVEAEIQKTVISMPPEEAAPALPPLQPPKNPSTATGSSKLPITLRKGLLLHYDFAAAGKDKVTDKSGKRNDGENNGATWKMLSDGRKGVMDFDGKDDVVVLPEETLGNSSSLTFSIWAKLPRYSGGGWPAFIGSYVGNPGMNTGIGLAQAKGTLLVEVTTSKGNYKIPEGINAVPWDMWFHAVMVYDGESLTEYINAVRGASIGASGSLTTPTSAWLGKHHTRYGVIKGQLDDVMIWNRALSDEEVKQLYRMQGGK